MTSAVEEFLRFYSPVTMARYVTEDTEVAGCPMQKGDKVLMAFPAGNRDPEMFEDGDRFIIDRAKNRHFAFGSGIHRCLGSNLARMEIKVRSEERRVGKACVRTCRSRGTPDHYRHKHISIKRSTRLHADNRTEPMIHQFSKLNKPT